VAADAAGRKISSPSPSILDRRLTTTMRLWSFQADVASARNVHLLGSCSLGARGAHLSQQKDFRVYGRFNRERFDDFAWENDKVAFRMYGEALETWVRGAPHQQQRRCVGQEDRPG
jgi:hypothetical protein